MLSVLIDQNALYFFSFLFSMLRPFFKGSMYLFKVGSSALNCAFMNPRTPLAHNGRLSLEIVTSGENCAALETGFLSRFPLLYCLFK